MGYSGFLVTWLSPSPTAERFVVNDTYSQVIRSMVSEQPSARECSVAFTRRGDSSLKVNVYIYLFVYLWLTHGCRQQLTLDNVEGHEL
jgi:hypothetical protein